MPQQGSGENETKLSKDGGHEQEWKRHKIETTDDLFNEGREFFPEPGHIRKWIKLIDGPEFGGDEELFSDDEDVDPVWSEETEPVHPSLSAAKKFCEGKEAGGSVAFDADEIYSSSTWISDQCAHSEDRSDRVYPVTCSPSQLDDHLQQDVGS